MKKNLFCFYKLLPAPGLGFAFFMLPFVMPTKLSAQTDTTKKLKEVAVSSSALPKIQNITPVQQISAGDFERYSAFDVADAIRNFAGVILKDYGGIGGLKTISVRGLSANHTAVLYNGVQINDAENGQVDLSKLNLNNVQDISLYIGQPSAICMPARSFASSSVLSITTVKPNLTAVKPYQVTAGIKAGSFGLVNPYLQLQQRINNNWSVIVNGYLENANGRYKYKTSSVGADSVHTRNNDNISAGQADGALYWAKTDINRFNLHLNYYDSGRGIPGAVVLYNPATSRTHLWNQDLFLQTGYEHLWRNSLHLLINAKVSRNYLRYLDPDYFNNEGRLDQRFTQHEYYGSAALAYKLTDSWELSYAADISVNNLDANLANFSYPTRLSLLNVLATNLTIGRLQLQGSLLNTNITETVKSGTASKPRNVSSPTLMASVLPFKNSSLQLRAFYKYTFRNPTFDELYYSAIGNTTLKPEYTKQYDLGTTYSKALNGFFNYITLTADAYYNNVSNKIVFIPKDAFNRSIQNFGKVDIKGVDIGLKTQAKPFDKWKASLAVNYSYQQALNVTDPTSSVYLNQLPYTPKNTVSLNAGVDHGHLGVYYNQVISSSRYFTNENIAADYLAGYSTSDASVVYRFLLTNKPVVASAEVNNLFSTNYAVVQSYPMPGRSLRFSIQITI